MISKKIATAVGAGAIAGALGISLAGGAFTANAATTSTAKTHTAAGAAAAHKGHKGMRGKHKGGEFGRVLHGTGVVKTKTGYETIAVDRGTVTAVSPTAVTLKSADGVSETFTPVAASKYRIDGKSGALSAVTVGQTASTVAVVTGGANDIKVLIVRPVKAATSTTTGTGA